MSRFHLVDAVIGCFVRGRSDRFDSHLRVDASVEEEGGEMSGGMNFVIVRKLSNG